MRDAAEWEAAYISDEYDNRQTPFRDIIRAIQRDALESAAKVCDQQAARARNRDNEGAADECDSCYRRIRALIPKDTDHARS